MGTSYLGNPRWQYFPRQKLATKDKDKSWYKKCIDAAEDIAVYREVNVRQTKRNMRINYDLMNDILNQNDLEKLFDPLDFSREGFSSLETINNYPIILPKVDLLAGEEIKRRFDWSVRSINEDAVSSIQEQLHEELMGLLNQFLESESETEEELQKKLQKFAQYATYEFKDVFEETGTRILKYLWREEDLKRQFNEGFRDALIAGEEIYRIDIVAGEPRVIRCNPLQVYTVRSGDSHFVEDADIVVEIEYLPVSMVIDEFYDFLNGTQISQIEEGFDKPREGNILKHRAFNPRIYADAFLDEEQLISTQDGYSYRYSQAPYDEEGNVRVLRVKWRGLRKIGKLTFLDDNGDEQMELVPEGYKPDKDAGEKIKWIWISEAYEGVRIGEDIYVRYGPREVQARRINNLSRCSLGYVGTYYATNDSKTLSLVDTMRTYQYLYNVIMHRLELIISRHHGPIVEMDLAKKPDKWTNSMWLYYAQVMGLLIVDNFNEGKEGAAMGKLAMGANTSGKAINPDIGNYIQQQILLLQYIEEQLGNISGISRQRQGETSTRETKGGIERAISQSSHVTEKWFYTHDHTKRRVLSELLNTAKIAWRGQNKKTQFVLDDMSRMFLDVNGDDIATCEFDVFVTNSSEDTEMRQTLRELTHAMVQNGSPLSFVIDVMRSDSIAATARKIEHKEMEMRQEQSEVQQAEREAQAQSEQAQREHEASEKEKDRQIEREKIMSSYEIALLKLEEGEIQVGEDDVERLKLRIEEMKAQTDKEIKEREQREVERSNKAKEALESKKIAVQRMAAKNKPKPSKK